jgi:hypothetical protein
MSTNWHTIEMNDYNGDNRINANCKMGVATNAGEGI